MPAHPYESNLRTDPTTPAFNSTGRQPSKQANDMKSTIFERLAILIVLALAFGVPVIALAQENSTIDPPAAEQESDPGQEADEQDEDKKEADDEKDDKPARTRPRSDVEQYSKRASEFKDLLKPVLESVSDSTVTVMDGRKRLALGAIVDEDGLILTKASELSGEIECKLGNGDRLEATVIGVDPETDLALLKIEASGLPVVNWSDTNIPATGQWLVTPDAEGEPVGSGIVGVDAREIPRTRAFVGIRPVDVGDDNGVLITEVIDGTPADRANIKPDDIIIKIDEIEINNYEDLRDTLAQYDPNDLIMLTVLRDEKEIELTLNLADETNVNPDFDRSNAQNTMGSKLSSRRKDFPLAFQHDSQLQANQCGGPVVDLGGRVVGLNIARGGRVFSLALPVEIVRPVIEQLRTGDFAPAKVNEVQIEKIDKQLREVARIVKTLPRKKEQLEKKLREDGGRRAELQRMLADMEKRLEELDEQIEEDREELGDIGSKLRSAEKSKSKLEKDRRKLSTGS